MAKTVLIVDDSMYMRTLIREVLTPIGFEVVGDAGTGDDAIEMALDLEPDLITLDNILPDMMGTEILKVLKEEEGIDSHIIMISAVGQQSVVDEAKGLGAVGYIVKPFSNDQLIAEVQKVIS